MAAAGHVFGVVTPDKSATPRVHGSLPVVGRLSKERCLNSAGKLYSPMNTLLLCESALPRLPRRVQGAASQEAAAAHSCESLWSTCSSCAQVALPPCEERATMEYM